MCIIIKGSVAAISRLDLDLAWRMNSHGAGIIIPGKNPLVLKGIMKLDELKMTLKTIHPSKVIALHLRQATHGAINPANTHPFPAGKSTYLMHNGILLGLGEAGSHGLSDSAHLARILFNLSSYDKHSLLNTLQGRFLLCEGTKLTTFGDWEEYKKCEFSNSLLLPAHRTTTPLNGHSKAYAVTNWRNYWESA